VTFCVPPADRRAFLPELHPSGTRANCRAAVISRLAEDMRPRWRWRSCARVVIYLASSHHSETLSATEPGSACGFEAYAFEERSQLFRQEEG
jgi:hypothetical protein